MSRWFVDITTDVGQIRLPFGSLMGYRTKREAEFVAAESMQHVPGIISADVKEEK